MSWVALLFVPLILAYQAWSYWVFRKRISVKHIPESPTDAAGCAHHGLRARARAQGGPRDAGTHGHRQRDS